MSAEAWELIFLMFVLKLPIAYVVGVVIYAIRAAPEPGYAELVPVRRDEGPSPCPWHRHRARRRPDRPRPVTARALG